MFLAWDGELLHTLPRQQKCMTRGVTAGRVDIEHRGGSSPIPKPACVTGRQNPVPCKGDPSTRPSLPCTLEAESDPNSPGCCLNFEDLLSRQTRGSLLLSGWIPFPRCSESQMQAAVALQPQNRTFFYLRTQGRTNVTAPA